MNEAERSPLPAYPQLGAASEGWDSGAASGTEPRLPRPPGVLRRFLAKHPMVVDATIAGTYLFGCLLMGLIDAGMHLYENPFGEPAPSATLVEHWPYFVATVVTIPFVFAALLKRRKYPFAGFVAIAIACVLTIPESAISVANGIALFFAIYAVPVYRSMASGWIAWAIAVAATVSNGLIGTWLGILGENEQLSGVTAISGVSLLIPLLIGINLGNRRRYLQAIIDRAHQLARERDQLARLAVAEERSRIARDMHDIVAHSVSVMIALSEGAARTIEVAPNEAAEALRRSAETGRTALAEMRRLLGALGAPEEGASTADSAELVPATLAPQPGVAEIPGLIETFRSAGMPIELEITGTSTGDQGQELAVYRVVQEALTNALRHGGAGAPVRVVLEHSAVVTELEVTNGAGPHSGAGLDGLGSGRGLRGLAERVRVVGGVFEAGPLPGGGWRVHATFPVNKLASAASAAGIEGDDRGGDDILGETEHD